MLTTIQDLHSTCLADRTGRIVNGVGAGLLLLMCMPPGWSSGGPGLGSWRRGFMVDLRRSWRRVNLGASQRDGHLDRRADLVWALDRHLLRGSRRSFSSVVNAISPLTSPSHRRRTRRPRPPAARSSARADCTCTGTCADQYVFRVMPPRDDTGAFVVMFSPTLPAPVGPGQLTNCTSDLIHRRRLEGFSARRSLDPATVHGLGVPVAHRQLRR